MSQSIRGRTMTMEKECGSWATAWLHTRTHTWNSTRHRTKGRTRERAVQGRAGEKSKGKGYARAKVAEI